MQERQRDCEGETEKQWRQRKRRRFERQELRGKAKTERLIQKKKRTDRQRTEKT